MIKTPSGKKKILHNREYLDHTKQLKDYYPEYVEVKNLCKFRDCNHINEQGCQVLELISSNVLSKKRHERYVDLFELDKEKRKKY